jgi:ABC-2 type transport system ATP-binding protein
MIEVRNLRKSFDGKAALDGLTFSVGRGEVYGLLGPNGAGKTTAINILCNLLDADAGTVTIEGSPVSASTKCLIGVVPQEISIYRDLTCKENLFFFATIYGLRRSQGIARAEELIRLFRLEEYADTEVSKLSGGWQRRVNIAIALVHSPSALILDEPTAGLDIEARFELWRLLERLRSTGVTILLTTHLLDEAEKLCSRIGIIQKGRIAAEGSLDELRALVPAKQLVVVLTEDEGMFRRKASSFGWECRTYGGKLTLCLPQRFPLKAIVERFAEVALSSVTMQEIGLEHAYLEVTREGNASADERL